MQKWALTTFVLRVISKMGIAAKQQGRLTTTAARVGIFLSFMGLAVSAYLTYIHYQPEHLICSIKKGCDIVNSSQYAAVFNIPVAAWGMFYYVVAALLFARGASTRWLLIWTTIGVLSSSYLTYLEAFVIHAWCQWCVASGVITVLLFVLALIASRREKRDNEK